MIGGTPPRARPGGGGAGGRPPGWVVISLAVGAARANRLMAEHWESLVETYPDQVEHLAVLFGSVLRRTNPDAAARHRRDRLEFGRSEDGLLALAIGEPLRGALGWGGAAIEARRAGSALRLPVQELFLAFARGAQPEWVARLGGFPLHRAVVVEERVVGHLARLVFGPPAGAAPGEGPP